MSQLKPPSSLHAIHDLAYHGQKRRWLQARDKSAAKTWDAWAAAQLDRAAEEVLDE
jgi:hypothetical protein